MIEGGKIRGREQVFNVYVFSLLAPDGGPGHRVDAHLQLSHEGVDGVGGRSVDIASSYRVDGPVSRQGGNSSILGHFMCHHLLHPPSPLLVRSVARASQKFSPKSF